MATRASGTASGGQLEEKVDLSAETDAKLEQAKRLAGNGNLAEALALLAALEKRCRVGNDNASLIRVCITSCELCKEASDHDALVRTLQTLSTRRSQKTGAVRALVTTALPWCVDEPYSPVKVSSDEAKTERDNLVKVLREMTDGKIFLERERAVLTRAMATIEEQDGDIAKAASVLQEVHVETYGSLSKTEKVEFILEQLRLTLGAHDFVRAAIVAGKVSRKHLQEENMQNYKISFYTLLAISHRHQKDAFALAQDYHAIYSTASVQQEETKWMKMLEATVLFLAMSQHSNEQQDMMHRISLDTNLEKLPVCQATLKLLLTKEIIAYPTPHQAELESLAVFSEGDLKGHWHEIFRQRIIQHNIRVASLYYKRIHCRRLAMLLKLDPAELEREISGMVSDGSLYAKIDRPNDTLRFRSAQSPESVLTDWSSDIDKLLHLVETTTHLIHKERMTSA